MTTIKASGSFVSFTLSLEDDHHVKVLEDLLSLRFNLQIGSIYVEQEMYSINGDIFEIILIPKNMCQDDYIWILDLGSFRVIGLPDFQIQASTVLLYGASNVNVSSMATIKIEPSDDDVIVLLNSDSDDCLVIDLSDTSHFSYKTKPSNPVLIFVDVDKTPHNTSYTKFVRHSSFSQRSPLHPSSSSSYLNIVDALKMIKSRRRSKFNLIAIDFDSIYIRDVKYLPRSFDVIFILLLINVDVSSTYGRSIDGINKMCNGHPWCTTKTTNIQNDFGLSFRRSSYTGHL